MQASATFTSEVLESWAALSKEKGNENLKPKTSPNQAYNIYQNTFTSPYDCIVLGPDRMRKDPELVRKWGLITFTSGKKTGNEGAILGEQQWSLLINDSFLLGAIHKKKRVILHVEEKDLKTERLWDKAKNKPTTFGRELIILHLAGYREISRDSEGITLSITEENSLPTIKELWQKLKMVDKLVIPLAAGSYS